MFHLTRNMSQQHSKHKPDYSCAWEASDTFRIAVGRATYSRLSYSCQELGESEEQWKMYGASPSIIVSGWQLERRSDFYASPTQCDAHKDTNPRPTYLSSRSSRSGWLQIFLSMSMPPSTSLSPSMMASTSSEWM